MTSFMSGSPAAARKTLTVLWFCFFVTLLAVTTYLYLANWIEVDNFKTTLGQLNTLYAPYLGVVTLYYWAGRGGQTSEGEAQAGTSFVLALVVSLVWNLMMVAFLMPLVFQSGTVENAVENMEYVGGLLSWGVAGAIGYYFATPSVVPAGVEQRAAT